MRKELQLNLSNPGAQSSGTVVAIQDIDEVEPIDPTEQAELNTTAATVATVAVVGVGALVFEAALLPGLCLGVAAMLVPKYLPQIGTALNPLVKSTVRGAYRLGHKTREMVAEAEEHVHDMVAEVGAEAKDAATESVGPKRPVRNPTA